MSSIVVTGLDELIKEIEELDISDTEMRKALTKAELVAFPHIKNSLPVLHGDIRKSVKSSIRMYEGGLSLRITVHAFDAIYPEFGTSKQKNNVGKFENGVEEIAESVINIIAEECLKI